MPEVEFELPSSRTKAIVCDYHSSLAVIITHPWGPLGGSMQNNVVVAVSYWFRKLGVTTLRFNFVGTQIGRGHKQVDQVKEAADFLLQGKHLNTPQQSDISSQKKRKAPESILLVGYSYGSLICGSATPSIPQCVGLIMIAPPLAVRHWLYLMNGNYHLAQARKRVSMNRLFVIGSKDNFTSEKIFREIVDTFPEASSTGAVLKGADHFFARREKDLTDIVGTWLLSAYPQCNGDLNQLARLNFASYEAPPVEMNTSSIGVDGAAGCNSLLCASED